MNHAAESSISIQLGSLPPFEAETTFKEKAIRTSRRLLAAVCPFSCLYAIYSFSSGPVGWLAYASLIPALLTAKKALEVATGCLIYPMARNSFSTCFQRRVCVYQNRFVYQMHEKGYNVERMTLEKSGACYSAFLVTQTDFPENVWTVHDFAATVFFEENRRLFVKQDIDFWTNALIVSGPTVGESSGTPTRFQMGAGIEAGMQFLEKDKKATHIILHGIYHGGGAVAEAVLQHNFPSSLSTRYLVISECAYSRLTDVIGSACGPLVKAPCKWLGHELDGVAAAKKLSELGITQIVIQHGEDQRCDCFVPKEVSLASEVASLPHKIVIAAEEESPSGRRSQAVDKQIRILIAAFLLTYTPDRDSKLSG